MCEELARLGYPGIALDGRAAESQIVRIAETIEETKAATAHEEVYADAATVVGG